MTRRRLRLPALIARLIDSALAVAIPPDSMHHVSYHLTDSVNRLRGGQRASAFRSWRLERT
jgi:hypothetical protein